MQSKTKSTKNKYKNLSKNVALFTVSSFGSKIIAFLLVPLYTSILSTEEYGTADLILETVSLLIPILTIDIQDAVLRFTIGNGDKKNTISILLVCLNKILAYQHILCKSFGLSYP